jgi:hypothetical protein
VAYVPEVLADYRVHAGSMTGCRDPLLEHAMYLEVLRRAERAAPHAYGPLRRRALSRQYTRAARRLIDAGRAEEAKGLAGTAISLAPTDAHALAAYGATRFARAVRCAVGLRRSRLRRTASTAGTIVP